MVRVDCGEKEDEWELINDDGFVYNRKKRRHVDHTDVSTSAPPPPDLAAEEKNRRERKKRALLKLREKYQKEIDHWVHLSNTFKAFQENSLNHHQQQREHRTTSSCSVIDLPFPPVQSSETTCRRLVDELLLRVESEEAIVKDVSNLSNMAEAICNAQEQRTKQLFVDLSIWAYPRELMRSLCDH